MRRIIALVGSLVLGATALQAQVQTKTFDLGTHLGQQVFSKGTAFENTPYVGLDATYELPWNPLKVIKGASFGLGLALDVSRPVTRGDQFPLVAFDFGDTTFLYAVAQRVTLLQTGVQGVVGLPVGDKLRVYGFGGPGVYSIFLDPRAVKKNDKFTKPMVSFGGGLNYALSASIGVRAQVKAVSYTGFDRNRLDATVSYIQDRRIRDAVAAPDATSKNPTNMQYSLVFQYIPGGK